MLITVGAGLVCGTAVNLLASANTYYAMYVLGDLNYMSLYSLIMTVGMLPASVILRRCAQGSAKRR